MKDFVLLHENSGKFSTAETECGLPKPILLPLLLRPVLIIHAESYVDGQTKVIYEGGKEFYVTETPDKIYELLEE